MKKLSTVLFLLVLGSVVPVYALDTIRVDIPFGFVVGDVTLPAGEYTIGPLANQGAMQIKNLAGHGAAFRLANVTKRLEAPEAIWAPGPTFGYGSVSNPTNNPKPASEECSVIFNKYGDQYFISRIWVGLEGREFVKGHRELEQRTAGVFHNQEAVVVAALAR